jgi:tetratricopeptide (TPR) repeat protein
MEHVRLPDDVSTDRMGEFAGGRVKSGLSGLRDRHGRVATSRLWESPRGGQRRPRSLVVVLVAAFLVAAPALDVSAADQWIEVKSAHFTVVSNAGERSTRKLVWQLEQVRSAMAALWSWAQPDLNKPLSVIAVKDESGMRALAPQYWEDRKAIRPASVWVTGSDEHYLAIRTDVEVDDRGTINPYITAYWSYVGLVLHQSVAGDMPLWFTRGFTGVLSNTIVRDDHILLGAPIPWELQILRERSLLLLPKLLAVTRKSSEATQADPREVYDAETWAFVHFLMFGDQGKRAGALNAYGKLVTAGKDPAVAFTEALGPIDALEAPFRGYIQRSVFSYQRITIDVSVERERFPVRTLAPAEAASQRGLFHAAMGRPNESRAAIAEARKADANVAASHVAEGLLLDQEKKRDEAKAAFAKAAELGSTSAYAHYRLASLTWRPDPPREALVDIERHLTTAVGLNVRYAAAYAWLGEVRAYLGNTESIGLIRRAISLEPRESRHRLRAAHVLMHQGKAAEARVDAQAALTIAETDEERRDAQELLDAIAKAKVGDAHVPPTSP